MSHTPTVQQLTFAEWQARYSRMRTIAERLDRQGWQRATNLLTQGRHRCWSQRRE